MKRRLTAATETAATAQAAGATPVVSDRGTLRRGLQLAPEMTRGLRWTLLLALVATTSNVIVPMTIQRAIDDGILAPGGIDLGVVRWTCALAVVGVVVAGMCSYVMNVRLFKASEAGLATLRVKAFAHVHALSTLTLNASRRGSMVSRVTSDVDQISMFVQRGGMMLIVSIGQLLVATALMLWYSPLLTAVVWATFVPLVFLLRHFQRVVGRAYGVVRERVADMLSAISESVAGAATVRLFGVQERTQARMDETIERQRRAAISAQIRAVGAFVSGQGISGLALVLVLAVGAWQGAHGRMSVGEITAFVFLTNLFTQPVQTATEVLNDLQNALAGWRRIIEVLDTPLEVEPPTEAVTLPRGPVGVEFDDVTFAYRAGDQPAIVGLTASVAAGRRVAVVGETGSGKSTLAKLLTRLVDPSDGFVRLGGVDLRDLDDASLRASVAYLPQEGFLFDGTIADNVRFARPDLSNDDVAAAFDAIGCGAWLAGQPAGVLTQVGARGGRLSAGERQLVALARTYVAGPDVLVLDEATSSVDPTMDVAVGRALDQLMTGRTSVVIAHRLASAESADEVWVMDAGRLVQRGPHTALVAADGPYARLHAGWVASHAH